MESEKQLLEVPVVGGALTVARWASQGPRILLVHGISSSHMAWSPIARILNTMGYDVIAPDLRGRGASNSIQGEYGLKTHGEDLCRVIEFFSNNPVIVAGHSMGAYVGVEFATRFPSYLDRLILVDGGVALPRPADVKPEIYLRKTLGPAIDRLSLEFDDVAAYFDFWRAHPAFEDLSNWNQSVEQFFEYDLEPTGNGHFKSRVIKDAIFRDGEDLMASGMVTMIDNVLTPMLLLTAERGLLNQPNPMLPVSAVKGKVRAIKNLQWQEIPDTNHYSITLSTGILPVSKAISDFCSSDN